MGIRDDFRAALLTAAKGTVGIRETSANSGPEIDDWLRYVHCKPGDPWCAAWVASMHDYAAKSVNSINPCPRSGSVLTMWSLVLPDCKVDIPFPGCVYFLDHGQHRGHCGIVEVVSPAGIVMSEISGNTNGAGSREGNQVQIHYGAPEVSHGGTLIGYADFSQLVWQ